MKNKKQKQITLITVEQLAEELDISVSRVVGMLEKLGIACFTTASDVPLYDNRVLEQLRAEPKAVSVKEVPLLTLKQAAKFFDRPAEWLEAMCRQHRIPFVFDPDKGLLFDPRKICPMLSPKVAAKQLELAQEVK